MTEKEGITLTTELEPLYGLRQWVVWGRAEATGKDLKRPVNPVTGGWAAVDDPHSWTTHAAALDAVASGQARGLGFVPAVDGDVTFIDFDHCIQDGRLDPWVAGWVARLDSYTELSMSGTGLHVLCYGRLGRAGVHTRKAELYDCKHFVALTERPYGPVKPLRKVQGVIDDLLAEIHPMPAVNPTVPPVGTDVPITDEELKQRLVSGLEHDVDLAALFRSTDHSGDESATDFALLKALARVFPKDVGAVLRAADSSPWVVSKDPRHSKKWQRQDYRAGTARRAVDAADALTGFVEVLSTDDLDRLRPERLARVPWSDAASGQLFADWAAPTARYCPELRLWMVYDGTRWVQDLGGLRVAEFCKRLAQELAGFAARIGDDDQRQAYMKWACRWQSRRVRDTVLTDAASVHPVAAADLDADSEVLNVSNGTLDLRSGELRAHEPGDLLSKLAAVDFVPGARCARWERFVDEIFEHDLERVRFFQKACGLCLTGDTSREQFFIAYGPSTRNGKSTALGTLARMLGDYARTAAPATVAKRSRVDGGAASEDLARLAGVRLVTINELPAGMQLDVAAVKALTGGDTITARQLYANSFEFVPQFKLWMNTNSLPQVTDVTLFSSGRVAAVPFNRHFSEAEQDKGLKTLFARPESLSGILNWALTGLRLLCAEGLTVPVSVQTTTAEYQRRSDRLGRFFEDCCVVDPVVECRTEDLYRAYREWCQENGTFAKSAPIFKAEVEQQFTTARKRIPGSANKQWTVLGVRLLDLPQMMDFPTVAG